MTGSLAFALVCALWIVKAFSGAAEKTKETLRLSPSPPSDLPDPHFFGSRYKGE